MFSINNTGCSVYSLISSTGFETVGKLKVFWNFLHHLIKYKKDDGYPKENDAAFCVSD